MPSARPVRSFTLVFALAALGLGACAQGSLVVDGGGAGSSTSGSGDTGEPAELCSIQNCHADVECSGCSGARFTCLLAERRCVACDPDVGVGCAEGEVCSSFGACIGEGQTCATDAGGEPMITCTSNGDCAACDPQHQVCEQASGRCVACSPGDTSACTAAERCDDGRCAPSCPAACLSDGDCDQCGAPGHEAHACNAGKCAQCSPTSPCDAGASCSAQGVCVPDSDPSGSGSTGTSTSSTSGSGAGGSDPVGAGGSDPVGAGGGDPGEVCHDLCSAGEAMDPSCDPCVATLCAADDYCCSTAWDALCVSEVDTFCDNACSGAGGGCAHEECAQGEALDAACSDCATAVCAEDEYCCTTSWDSFCVDEVDLYCASSCP